MIELRKPANIIHNHNELSNLDYENSGHSGFQPAGDYLTNIEFSTYSGTLQDQIDLKSDNDHNHNNIYYTESEIDLIVDGVQSDINNKPETFIELIDTPTTYNNSIGKHLVSTSSGIEFDDNSYYTESEINELFGTISGSGFNIINIDTNGSDSLGDGSYNKPYKTIKYALSQVTDNSETNRYTFRVAPGIYEESNPLQLKKFTTVASVGGNFTTIIKAIDDTKDLFLGEDRTSLRRLVIEDTTKNGISMYRPGSMLIDEVYVVDCNTGVKINNTEALVYIRDLNGQTINTTSNTLLDISSGFCKCNDTSIVNNSTFNTIISTTGSESKLISYNLFSKSINVTSAFEVSNYGEQRLIGTEVENSTYGAKVYDGGKLFFQIFVNVNVDYPVFVSNSGIASGGSFIVRGESIYDIYQDDSTAILKFDNSNFLENNIHIVNWDNTQLNYMSSSVMDKEYSISEDLSVGVPEKGRSSHFGKGSGTNRGMLVYTAGLVMQNLTNVTNIACCNSETTFTFQDKIAGNSILIGLELKDDNDEYLKFSSIKINQVVAAVETIKRSFAIEIWNGIDWEGVNFMSISYDHNYSYANEIFLRSNSVEDLRLGDLSNWTKLNLTGTELYWLRIIIKSDLSTLPTFRKFTIETSKSRINSLGQISFYGLARFKDTLIAAGNIYGESGGVANSTVAISDNGWNHIMMNNQLNGINDSIYLQFNLPRGICTACPLNIIVIGHPEQIGDSTDGSISISVLPIEVAGVLEADPLGGINPVYRTLDNTENFNVNASQDTIIDINLVSNTKLASYTSNDINISNYYAGDMIAIKITYLDDGSGNKDFIIWSVEVEGIKYTLGENLR